MLGRIFKRAFWVNSFERKKSFCMSSELLQVIFVDFYFLSLDFPMADSSFNQILLSNSRMSLFELYLLCVFYFILQESNCQTMKGPMKRNQRQTRKGGKQLVCLFHGLSHWFLLFPVSSVLNVKVLVKDNFKKLVKPCPSSHQLTKNSSWHPF